MPRRTRCGYASPATILIRGIAFILWLSIVRLVINSLKFLPLNVKVFDLFDVEKGHESAATLATLEQYSAQPNDGAEQGSATTATLYRWLS